MAMVDLEVEADADLISKVDHLALSYFGDSSDASRARVVEVAFRMRCLWSRLVERGESEIAEPMTTWEFPALTVVNNDANGIRRWLFRR